MNNFQFMMILSLLMSIRSAQESGLYKHILSALSITFILFGVFSK
jgi:hypothetical protein